MRIFPLETKKGRLQMTATILSVSCSATYSFHKQVQTNIRLLAGLGVEGDAHMGATVKHQWEAARHPEKPNLRQVHLLHSELFEELRAAGFNLAPGLIGENITTRGIDLLNLPTGTRLHLGEIAIVELTGLRDPCSQLDKFVQEGLKAAMLDCDSAGNLTPKAGVMGIVLASGEVRPGDLIKVELPSEPYQPLGLV
jgi:MOSC domain-containing protein YiiM